MTCTLFFNSLTMAARPSTRESGHRCVKAATTREKGEQPMSATGPVIDLDNLMISISEDNPVGAELRYAPVDPKRGISWHDEIREAARENLYEQTPKHSDWPKVVELTTKALTKLSKDWQIAAWLAEALVKHDRFDRLAGLRDGARLMRGLMEQYWDNLYPAIDPEDGDSPLVGRINVVRAQRHAFHRRQKNTSDQHPVRLELQLFRMAGIQEIRRSRRPERAYRKDSRID